MGLLNEKESQSIPDAFGVPSYFVTDFFAEPAGSGLVRLYACARMNGALVPQYVVVMPVAAVLKGSALVRDTALLVMGDDTPPKVH